MLSKLYAKWMYAWETALTTRDTNRIVRPLEWGFDWLRDFSPMAAAAPHLSDTPVADDFARMIAVQGALGGAPAQQATARHQKGCLVAVTRAADFSRRRPNVAGSADL